MRVYRGKFGYILAIISESSVSLQKKNLSLSCVYYSIPISEIFEEEKNSIRFLCIQFVTISQSGRKENSPLLCVCYSISEIFEQEKNSIRFLCIQFVTISHRLQILFVREKRVFYLISSFFFFEKGQRFRCRKRKKKRGERIVNCFYFHVTRNCPSTLTSISAYIACLPPRIKWATAT